MLTNLMDKPETADSQAPDGRQLPGKRPGRAPNPIGSASRKARLSGLLIAWATKLVKRGLVDLRLSGEEHVLEAVRQGRSVVFAGWHGHNFLTIASYYRHLRKRFQGAVIMVPDNAQGQVLEQFGFRTGFDVVKANAELGPSQWARATVSLIKLVRGGHCVLLSPDGPTGPACKVKPGIAVIARQAKAVVIPASAGVRYGFKLRKRWDEHLVPLPFTRAVVRFGAPIDACPVEGEPPSAEELQARIEAALRAGADEAAAIARSGGAGKGGGR